MEDLPSLRDEENESVSVTSSESGSIPENDINPDGTVEINLNQDSASAAKLNLNDSQAYLTPFKGDNLEFGKTI